METLGVPYRSLYFCTRVLAGMVASSCSESGRGVAFEASVALMHVIYSTVPPCTHSTAKANAFCSRLQCHHQLVCILARAWHTP
jgi:hypothetical protein